MSTAYGYSIHIPAPLGLDGERYVVTLGVYRRTGSALTKAEITALEAALAPLAAAGLTPVGDPAVAAAAEDRAQRRQAAMVAKATGASRKPVGKGKAPGKTSRTKPRKASKAPTRKAARRPPTG